MKDRGEVAPRHDQGQGRSQELPEGNTHGQSRLQISIYVRLKIPLDPQLDALDLRLGAQGLQSDSSSHPIDILRIREQDHLQGRGLPVEIQEVVRLRAGNILTPMAGLIRVTTRAVEVEVGRENNYTLYSRYFC